MDSLEDARRYALRWVCHEQSLDLSQEAFPAERTEDRVSIRAVELRAVEGFKVQDGGARVFMLEAGEYLRAGQSGPGTIGDDQIERLPRGGGGPLGPAILGRDRRVALLWSRRTSSAPSAGSSSTTRMRAAGGICIFCEG
jgi:hypothetical protein